MFDLELWSSDVLRKDQVILNTPEEAFYILEQMQEWPTTIRGEMMKYWGKLLTKNAYFIPLWVFFFSNAASTVRNRWSSIAKVRRIWNKQRNGQMKFKSIAEMLGACLFDPTLEQPMQELISEHLTETILTGKSATQVTSMKNAAVALFKCLNWTPSTKWSMISKSAIKFTQAKPNPASGLEIHQWCALMDLIPHTKFSFEAGNTVEDKLCKQVIYHTFWLMCLIALRPSEGIQLLDGVDVKLFKDDEGEGAYICILEAKNNKLESWKPQIVKLGRTEWRDFDAIYHIEELRKLRTQLCDYGIPLQHLFFNPWKYTPWETKDLSKVFRQLISEAKREIKNFPKERRFTLYTPRRTFVEISIALKIPREIVQSITRHKCSETLVNWYERMALHKRGRQWAEYNDKVTLGSKRDADGLGARTSDGRAGAGVVVNTTPVELMSDAGAFPVELTEATQVSGGARI